MYLTFLFKNCWPKYSHKYLRILFSDLPPTGCVDGEVRLIERDFLARGVLQLCHNDEWGTLCLLSVFNSQPFASAEIACRQLGFDQGESVTVAEPTLDITQCAHIYT